MKRLQIMIDEDLDAELERRASRELCAPDGFARRLPST
jgi:hypothetical protein